MQSRRDMNIQTYSRFTSTSRMIWFAFFILCGTIIGVYLGWMYYGTGGAIGMGLIGLIVGAVIGAAPSLMLEFLSN